jgi:hypothetical protein
VLVERFGEKAAAPLKKAQRQDGGKPRRGRPVPRDRPRGTGPRPSRPKPR